MPCDDNSLNKNIVEFKQTLNEIDVVCNTVDTPHIIIGGDFNTDFSRKSHFTDVLFDFINNENLMSCVKLHCNAVSITRRHKGTGIESLIDHMFVDEALASHVVAYHEIDRHDNFSDHVAVRCMLNIDASDLEVTCIKPSSSVEVPLWKCAKECDIANYHARTEELLDNIVLPADALQCNDVMCTDHYVEICNFHDDIINSLLQSSLDTIPTSRSKENKNKKVIPGWNDYVKRYFEASQFWHSLWINNNKPKTGIIADIRRKTRARYHLVIKMVKKYEAEIRCDKMSESKLLHDTNGFWSQAKMFKHKSKSIPTTVDEIMGEHDIAQLFAQKFEKLYNSVPYDPEHMERITKEVNDKILRDQTLPISRTINVQDVHLAIRSLKHGKSDGSNNFASDHILYASQKLHVYISMLFKLMLNHGLSPDSMVKGTMVPIPKGRWNNLNNSDNFRAITLSSIFGKILDIIILRKEESNLLTSELQFSFKKNSSTSLCTAMVKETVSYFVNNDSNVYALMLDASKAFDRVNFCKLFDALLARNINPFYCRLLLDMYSSQQLRVRWANTESDYFLAQNGVKQGGVISPVLFCIYMDGLLNRLLKCGSGCHMGGTFTGAFGYADDLTLLSPSVSGLKNMINICESYANEYDILFNGKKSQLLIFKCTQTAPLDPGLHVCGSRVPRVNKTIHLGHMITDEIYKFDSSKYVGDFNKQCNMFFSDFGLANSFTRNTLFQNYCTSFYGVQIHPLFDSSIKDISVAWRKAVRKCWRLPYQTHCNVLPHIAGVMDPEMVIAKRAIKFLLNALESKNQTVHTVMKLAMEGMHSILGSNIRFLGYHYNMCESDVF